MGLVLCCWHNPITEAGKNSCSMLLVPMFLADLPHLGEQLSCCTLAFRQGSAYHQNCVGFWVEVTLHAGPVGKLEAAAGARRIRRTITHTLPSGEKASREIIFTDQEKVGPRQPCVQRS